MEPRQPQVFISYSHADRDTAHRIAEALKATGPKVWVDEWELVAGDSIADRIQSALSASDFLLVLLSPNSVNSHWVKSELSSALQNEMRDRAITIVPAMIEDCEIPPLLSTRQILDLRKDRSSALQHWIDQIRVAPEVDFNKLDWRAFEKMVADLLRELGFTVQPIPTGPDMGVDLIASNRSRDPFGVSRSETWLVQMKLYREQRVSVSALGQMAVALMAAGGGRKGLIITNGRLTSVARDFLHESTDRLGRELRVIEGAELTNLITQHPDLIRKYFAASSKNE